jgi:aquaporin Z
MNSQRVHWPEYLTESLLLGLFMISACTFTILLEHPESSLVRLLPDPFMRRALIGIAMGLTAITLIYSPLGRRSGAHMNPSLTLSYLRLGKIERRDAFFYLAAQFAGGVAGVMFVRLAAGMLASDPSVRFAVTAPGMGGQAEAFVAEFAISFVLMTLVLASSNSRRFAPFTGLFAGLLVASYITFEAPISGMSMNPARSFASALAARHWTALWIYFVAPPLGMLSASEVYARVCGAPHIFCAKLNHGRSGPCIFRCNHPALYREA